MAAVQTTVDNGGIAAPRIYKFAGVDCIAGETLPIIDAAAFKYAVFYAVEATDTAGAGAGKVFLRAVLPDDSSAICNGVDTDSDADLDAELPVMTTTATVLTGSVLEFLPARFVLVHNGGNTGTALTIDLYVELHA